MDNNPSNFFHKSRIITFADFSEVPSTEDNVTAILDFLVPSMGDDHRRIFRMCIPVHVSHDKLNGLFKRLGGERIGTVGRIDCSENKEGGLFDFP